MNHKYPDNILKRLRQYKGLDEDSEMLDIEFEHWSPVEVMDAVVDWEGLVNYGPWIRQIVKDIFEVDLNRVEHECAAPAQSKVELQVRYYPYRRYEDTPEVVGTVIAADVRSALLRMSRKLLMYNTEKYILDMEEENGCNFSDEELLNVILDGNGDGCDFVRSIKNVTTGEFLFESDVFEEGSFENWTETVDE